MFDWSVCIYSTLKQQQSKLLFTAWWILQLLHSTVYDCFIYFDLCFSPVLIICNVCYADTDEGPQAEMH